MKTLHLERYRRPLQIAARQRPSENKLPRGLCMVDLSRAPAAVDILRGAAEFDYKPANRSLLLSIIDQYEILWSHVDIKIDKEVLSRARRLKVINTASTGRDHIEMEECNRRGVRVLSITNDYGLLDTFTATAECAWMLMLACHRQLRAALQSVLQGQWCNEPFCGEQLSRRTLGVLGVGRLGRMTAEYGKAFRMRVLGCDLKPFAIPGVEQVDFDTLIRESDAISIHIHMTRENYHLFNAATFAKMKTGAILVNTSRGDIIDEDALIGALDSGKLAAFGADVLHDEWREKIGDSPLVRYARTHTNVVITPHIGGCTLKSVVDARVFSARKLAQFLQTGEELVMPMKKRK